jgi:hypothetical protein
MGNKDYGSSKDKKNKKKNKKKTKTPTKKGMSY